MSTGHPSEKTVVSYGYPEVWQRGINERHYPIASPENAALYARYMEDAGVLSHVHFIGRLGAYRYFDMDKAVESVFALLKNLP